MRPIVDHTADPQNRQEVISGIKGGVNAHHSGLMTMSPPSGLTNISIAGKIGRSPNYMLPMTLKFKSEVSSFPTKHSDDSKVFDTNFETSDTKLSNIEGNSSPRHPTR